MSSEVDAIEGRSKVRQYVAMLVIGVATAQALGVAIKSPTQLEANDISRWCTVWSLIESERADADVAGGGGPTPGRDQQ